MVVQGRNTIDEMNKALEQIATSELGIETLAVRNSDQLDFYDVAVWSIRAALKAAFEAGAASGTTSRKRQ